MITEDKYAHEDKSNKDTGEDDQCLRSVRVINESGLSLIGRIEASLLIDMGSTISPRSRVMFEKLLKEHTYQIKGVSEPILSANGTPLDVLGQTEVGITVGESRLQQPVVIANICVDGILGMDFPEEVQLCNLLTKRYPFSVRD